jgi:hypothetical protein
MNRSLDPHRCPQCSPKERFHWFLRTVPKRAVLCCVCEINADSSLKAFCELAPNKPEASARPGWKGSIPLAKPGYDCFNVRRKKRQNKRRRVGMIGLDKIGF